MAENSGQPIKQELSEKLLGYGEGVVHGFEAASQAVFEATNGVFRLQEPNEVAAWRARLKRAGRTPTKG